MDFTELLAKQGILAEIYNRRKREYKTKKAREEKARAKALRQIKKAGVLLGDAVKINPLIKGNKIGELKG